MNSLSKVTLLVTLLTVPFAGFAMDNGDFPSFDLGQSTEKSAEVVTDNAGKALIVAGALLVGSVTLYGLRKGYNWFYGKPANSVAKEVNPVAVAITKGKITSAQLTEWAKQESKLKTKLADNGLTMDQYQAWVKTQAK